MANGINDWFEVHLRRDPHGGTACVTYEYPRQPLRTLELDNGVPEGCRGDPNVGNTGEYPTFTVHHLCNEGLGLEYPWVIGDRVGRDIVAASIIVEGSVARAAVRGEDGVCSGWLWTATLVPGGACPCPPTPPGHSCRTPPCWSDGRTAE